MEVSPDDSHVLYLGAFDRREPTRPQFAWPGTEVRLGFRGTAISVELTDTPFEDETRQTDWIAIQVDEGPLTKLALSEGKRRYELSRDLAPGEHRLRLIKRTEPEVGTITLHGFTLPSGSELRASPRPKRRILFVGDSITAGYGNEGASAECHYSPATSDATRTFASLAAQTLGAEALISAWSGKGVMRNFEARDEHTMAALFMRTLPGDASSPAIAYQPALDAVVVALGSNDFFPGVPDEQAFLSAYRGLLHKLSAHAPRAAVLLVLGPMLADDHPHPYARSTLQRWLSKLKREREQAKTKVALIAQWVDPAEGLGCDSHPSTRTHERLGRELSAALRKLCGW